MRRAALFAKLCGALRWNRFWDNNGLVFADRFEAVKGRGALGLGRMAWHGWKGLCFLLQVARDYYYCYCEELLILMLFMDCHIIHASSI